MAAEILVVRAGLKAILGPSGTQISDIKEGLYKLRGHSTLIFHPNSGKHKEGAHTVIATCRDWTTANTYLNTGKYPPGGRDHILLGKESGEPSKLTGEIKSAEGEVLATFTHIPPKRKASGKR